jgi:hypothetical protein
MSTIHAFPHAFLVKRAATAVRSDSLERKVHDLAHPGAMKS